MPTSDKYLYHLQAARAFAIVCVVGAHAWSFPIFWTGQLSSQSIEHVFWFTETFFHGSTLYFAMISGLLFTKVLSTKGVKRFYQNKVLYVILPYLFFSLFFTAYYFDSAETKTVMGFAQLLGFNLLMGKAWIHFWYMPVLAFLFLITPLLFQIQKRSSVCFVLIMLIPLIISRSPFPDFVKPQSFVYFMGAYAIGMWMGANYSCFINKVHQVKSSLLVVAVSTSIALYCLYVNGYEHQGIYSIRQTLVYLQKVAIFALLLSWLCQKENAIPKWSLVLADYAFTIFFVHVFFIAYFIQFIAPTLTTDRSGLNIALFGSINLILCIVLSIAFGMLFKQVFKQHSKKLIGA